MANSLPENPATSFTQSPIDIQRANCNQNPNPDIESEPKNVMRLIDSNRFNSNTTKTVSKYVESENLSRAKSLAKFYEKNR
jgi:hypothetical protein